MALPPLWWHKDGETWTATLPGGQHVRYAYEQGALGRGPRGLPIGRWRSHGRITIQGAFGSPMAMVRQNPLRRLLAAIGYAAPQRVDNVDFDRRAYLLTEDPQCAREIGIDPLQQQAILAAFDAKAELVGVDADGITVDFRSLPNLAAINARDGTQQLDRLAGLVAAIADRRRKLPVRMPDTRRDRWRLLASYWQFAGLAALFAVMKWGARGNVAAADGTQIVLCAVFLAIFCGPALLLWARRSDADSALAMLPMLGLLGWLASDRAAATAIDRTAPLIPHVEIWPVTAVEDMQVVAGSPPARFEDAYEEGRIVPGRHCMVVSVRRGALGALVDDAFAAAPCEEDPRAIETEIRQVRAETQENRATPNEVSRLYDLTDYDKDRPSAGTDTPLGPALPSVFPTPAS